MKKVFICHNCNKELVRKKKDVIIVSTNGISFKGNTVSDITLAYATGEQEIYFCSKDCFNEYTLGYK